MTIVEVREPCRVLETLESIREAVEAVYREMISGISVMTFTNVKRLKGELDEVIETYFEVRDV